MPRKTDRVSGSLEWQYFINTHFADILCYSFHSDSLNSMLANGFNYYHVFRNECFVDWLSAFPIALPVFCEPCVYKGYCLTTLSLRAMHAVFFLEFSKIFLDECLKGSLWKEFLKSGNCHRRTSWEGNVEVITTLALEFFKCLNKLRATTLLHLNLMSNILICLEKI